jgi:agmatinase
MKLKLAKKNFLDLPLKCSNWENSKVIVVPFGLETSVSYGHGTKNGPRAIIEASQEVELFDEELVKETYKEIALGTLEEFSLAKKVDQSLDQLKNIVEEIVEAKKFPIILGGEHTLTKAPINFLKDQYKNLTILQFDAHADLRDSLEGDKNSHATVMRRCLELSPNINLVQIGIRNISRAETDGGEYDFWQNNQNRIKTFWAREMENWKIEEMLNACQENVYLSFDVDAFDPSIMPSTGTPEPGGLKWHQVLAILKNVSQKKRIIGADFVELAPIKDFPAPDFMMAKLIYKFIGYLK